MNLTQELDVTERLVRQAGDLVRRFYKEGATVDWKGANDPVTAADMAANDVLVNGLRSAFPADGILSEESADDRQRLERHRVWIVDPLDGTREFVDGIEEFAIMVGLAVDGRPALGVVYQPVADRLFRAIPGQLAELVQADRVQPLMVSTVSEPAEMRLVASRSHRNPLVESVRSRLGIRQDRPSGSVGLKVGLLATADCDLYIHPAPGLKEWDTCAPEAVLTAAGGVLTDAWGRPLRYNKADVRQRQGLLASNGLAHDRIVAATRVATDDAGFSTAGGFW